MILIKVFRQLQNTSWCSVVMIRNSGLKIKIINSGLAKFSTSLLDVARQLKRSPRNLLFAQGTINKTAGERQTMSQEQKTITPRLVGDKKKNGGITTYHTKAHREDKIITPRLIAQDLSYRYSCCNFLSPAALMQHGVHGTALHRYAYLWFLRRTCHPIYYTMWLGFAFPGLSDRHRIIGSRKQKMCESCSALNHMPATKFLS